MIGYDGNAYSVGDRVEIHPSTNLWISGARYGVVVGSSLTPRDHVHVRMDKLPNRKFSAPEDFFRKVG